MNLVVFFVATGVLAGLTVVSLVGIVRAAERDDCPFIIPYLGGMVLAASVMIFFILKHFLYS